MGLLCVNRAASPLFNSAGSDLSRIAQTRATNTVPAVRDENPLNNHGELITAEFLLRNPIRNRSSRGPHEGSCGRFWILRQAVAETMNGCVRSGGPEKAELGQRLHAVIETDLLRDLAVMDA